MMTPFHTKVASTSSTADLITRIRNGNMRRKDFVICRTSGLGKGILEALWREGFIFGYQVLENEQESKVFLKYSEGRPVLQQIRLASKPGKPLYAGVKQLKMNRKKNSFMVSFLTTPKGVLSDREAISLNQGGQVLIEAS